MDKKTDKKELDKKLNQFLGDDQEIECTGEQCIIKGDKSLVERINKKVITEDGRELLI